MMLVNMKIRRKSKKIECFCGGFINFLYSNVRVLFRLPGYRQVKHPKSR